MGVQEIIDFGILGWEPVGGCLGRLKCGRYNEVTVVDGSAQRIKIEKLAFSFRMRVQIRTNG